MRFENAYVTTSSRSLLFKVFSDPQQVGTLAENPEEKSEGALA